MAKRDIKVNYGTLNSLVAKLNTYEKALGEMEVAVQAVGNMLSNGSGLAITNLVEKAKELQKKIQEMKTEVTDISSIIKSYVNDMTSIIAPISQEKMMQVDRNDIWWNLQSIIAACMRVSSIPRNVGTYGLPGGFSWDDDEDEIARKERNYDKLCDIKSELSNSQSAFSELIDKMKAFYKKVQNYENMDDAYKKKADGMKKKYTDFWEGVEDFLKWVGEGTVKLIKGLVTELAGSITGLFSLVVGVVKYAASAVVVNFDKVTNHKIPEWAETCYNGTNESVAAIVKDPVLIVEGMAQSISDTYEEEGIAYCTGYTVGTVAEFVIGSKGASKLGKAGKVEEAGEAAKIASKIEKAEETAKAGKEVVEELSTASKGSLDSTGTVWENIKPTQPMREGTQIPKSFSISIDGQEFWVNPNGTKHMYEYITRDAQHIGSFTTPVSSQTMLSEFEAALKTTVNKNGIKLDEMIYGGDWEFIIVPPREEGLSYVIKHARYNPK